MTSAEALPRLLLVGGGGGLVGRSVLAEFGDGWRIRSVHRSALASETAAGVEWIRADVGTLDDWRPVLSGVDAVLNVAWYRWGSEARFRALRDGLLRLVDAASAAGVRRFLHVSVPEAPPTLETGLPYLRYKRAIDRALVASGLAYRIVRPTMLFGDGDVLLSVMIRAMRRYPLFPMFGDGRYHVSPLAVGDLAHLLRLEAKGSGTGVVDVGGPERFEYRELTDRMFTALHRRARYWNLSPKGSLRLAGLLQSLGSSLLYRYEVEWLLSDRLGLPPYAGLDRPMVRVGSFLERLAAGARDAPSEGRS